VLPTSHRFVWVHRLGAPSNLGLDNKNRIRAGRLICRASLHRLAVPFKVLLWPLHGPKPLVQKSVSRCLSTSSVSLSQSAIMLRDVGAAEDICFSGWLTKFPKNDGLGFKQRR
jgi:hypothetical protein